MNEKEIIENIKNRLNIKMLNEIQNKTLETYTSSKNDIILLSSTGSGKTLAFVIQPQTSILNIL